MGGERVEELEPHLWVPGIEVGVAGKWVASVDSNSGDRGGGAPAMVVAGVMGLWLGEVLWDEGNLCRGSIGAEGGWMGVLHAPRSMAAGGDGRSARRRSGKCGSEWLGLKAS